nr:MAG TPA: hypothetical protein [Caudoviricetes sp.]
MEKSSLIDPQETKAMRLLLSKKLWKNFQLIKKES